MKMGYVGILVLGLIGVIGIVKAQLEEGFYRESCPRAEQIVKKYVHQRISLDPSLAAALLRMHFHDCFVRGCDASVLLDGDDTEKTAPPNLSLRGYEFINKLKSLLETECPGIVSCADIVSLMARDAVFAIGGPFWPVPTGRRDGTVSKAEEALSNLPPPSANIPALETFFANKGLDLKDLVVLSGAHTIGISHCSSFAYRLHNFTGNGDQDPSLDPLYAQVLKSQCPSLSSDNTVEMDPHSSQIFDRNYYFHVLNRRGLFESDAALLTNATTRELSFQLYTGSPLLFFFEFGQSMVKMGSVDVLTGTEGEIRRHCAVVNSVAVA